MAEIKINISSNKQKIKAKISKSELHVHLFYRQEIIMLLIIRL
jgi:hypothetical protein